MKNCIFKIPSFAPESRLIITFDTIVDSLTMIELITIPLYIGFEEDLFDKKYNVFLGLRTLGYIIFSIEIIMQFNIGYYS